MLFEGLRLLEGFSVLEGLPEVKAAEAGCPPGVIARFPGVVPVPGAPYGDLCLNPLVGCHFSSLCLMFSSSSLVRSVGCKSYFLFLAVLCDLLLNVLVLIDGYIRMHCP